MTDWTTGDVVYRLAEAIETLRRLPLPRHGRPAQRWTYWPDYVRDALEAYGYAKTHIRPGAPPPDKIKRMEETLEWLLWVADLERKLVFARAAKITWRALEDHDGRSRTTLKNVYDKAVETIVHRLNAKKS